MENKTVIDTLYYRYFRSLFKKNLDRFQGDTVLAFSHAIVESSNSKIKNVRALKTWAKRFSRCQSHREGNSDAA
jgi:hypothetical protein